MAKEKNNIGREKNIRGSILKETAEIIDGERNVDYGEPYDDFTTTAAFWQTYIERIINRRGSLILEAHDVAAMMMLLKTARLTWTADNKDHWQDAIGYAACGWECVDKEIAEYRDAKFDRHIKNEDTIRNLHERAHLDYAEVKLATDFKHGR